jgi:hypothetical protein
MFCFDMIARLQRSGSLQLTTWGDAQAITARAVGAESLRS